jgi:hypothetical protein
VMSSPSCSRESSFNVEAAAGLHGAEDGRPRGASPDPVWASSNPSTVDATLASGRGWRCRRHVGDQQADPRRLPRPTPTQLVQLADPEPLGVP